MIRVCVEVRQDAALFRVAVSADSISQAVGIAKGHLPNRDVRVVFPIDPEEFFQREKTEGNVGPRNIPSYQARGRT